ncbi:MAG: peptidase [Ramlibacter sp.]|nr:peptidase [Ramlibacter sp.]
MKHLLAPICAALLLLSAPAWADISRDDAAAVAQRASGGRVLSVEKAGSSWRVKVVTAKGEVRVILVDAATGRVQ